mmetsp:Transcript_2026/g.4087  ORF Transcript_2026/g.4087 Transcript_2026/m.4087 type:complete len:112 (+) Transcript_2026:248-583(+)
MTSQVTSCRDATQSASQLDLSRDKNPLRCLRGFKGQDLLRTIMCSTAAAISDTIQDLSEPRRSNPHSSTTDQMVKTRTLNQRDYFQDVPSSYCSSSFDCSPYSSTAHWPIV